MKPLLSRKRTHKQASFWTASRIISSLIEDCRQNCERIVLRKGLSGIVVHRFLPLLTIIRKPSCKTRELINPADSIQLIKARESAVPEGSDTMRWIAFLIVVRLSTFVVADEPTVPIAVSPDIHPISPPAFAVLSKAQQPIDDMDISLG